MFQSRIKSYGNHLIFLLVELSTMIALASLRSLPATCSASTGCCPWTLGWRAERQPANLQENGLIKWRGSHKTRQKLSLLRFATTEKNIHYSDFLTNIQCLKSFFQWKNHFTFSPCRIIFGVELSQLFPVLVTPQLTPTMVLSFLGSQVCSTTTCSNWNKNCRIQILQHSWWSPSRVKSRKTLHSLLTKPEIRNLII